MGCPGKWKHGPKPAVCPSCFILSTPISHHKLVCMQTAPCKHNPCQWTNQSEAMNRIESNSFKAWRQMPRPHVDSKIWLVLRGKCGNEPEGVRFRRKPPPGAAWRLSRGSFQFSLPPSQSPDPQGLGDASEAVAAVIEELPERRGGGRSARLSSQMQRTASGVFGSGLTLIGTNR